MRKIAIFTCLMAALTAFAQPQYKKLLQQLPQMNDQEALYKLDDYHQWFPKQAHPCYLIGKINMRLQANEHALMDYSIKSTMLYNGYLYFGNCMVLRENDIVKLETYPEATVNGKTSEENLTQFLKQQIADAKLQRARCEQLNSDYCTLVNRYDTCLQLFTALSEKYLRLRDMQMMFDNDDEQKLQRLETTAKQLPADIQHFQQALQLFPIEGYTPELKLRPITYYRLEGLTTSNFLQNEVYLWDYLTWTQDFRKQLAEINLLRQQLNTEQQRLQSHKPGKENKTLLNTLNKYDENSAIADLLHLEYLQLQATQLESRIMRDSVDEDALLEVLQLTYRLQNLQQEAIVDGPFIGHLLDSGTQRRYRDFISRFYAGGTLHKAPSDIETNIRNCYQRVQHWVLHLAQFTDPVRISETRVAYPGQTLDFREE